MSAQRQSGMSKENLPSSTFMFYSDFQRDETHSHWGGQSAFLSLQIQMLISHRNTLTNTPATMSNQISGHTMTQQTDT